MRRFLPLLSIVIVVAAFFAIAPAPGAERNDLFGIFVRDPQVAAAQRELQARSDSLRSVNTALARTLAWETARSLPESDAPMAFTVSGEVEPEAVRAFRALAEAQFAALPNPRFRVRVVLRQQADRRALYTKTIVLPQAADQPCVVIVTVPRQPPRNRPMEGERIMGTCGLYARFGYPGTGMQTWLEETRAVAAITDTAHTPPPTRKQRRKFTGGLIGSAPDEAACVAGYDSGCAVFVSNPYDIRGLRPIIPPNERTRAVVASYGGPANYGNGRILADIRDHVGPARFEEIWRSSQSLPEAFEAVTGEHIATWVRPQLLADVEPHHPGPFRDGPSLLFGLSLGVLASVRAITKTKRERS